MLFLVGKLDGMPDNIRVAITQRMTFADSTLLRGLELARLGRTWHLF